MAIDDNTELNLASAFELYLVGPLWFSVTAPGISPQLRPKALEQLRDYLNAADAGSNFAWNIQLFDEPRTLRLRKHGQIWRELTFSEKFIEELSGIYGQDLAGEVSARITYFDYGFGNIEVSTNLNTGVAGILRAAAISERLKLAFVKELNAGAPHADIDLMSLDKSVSVFLQDQYVGVENELRPKYDPEVVSRRAAFMCGPVSRNLLFFEKSTATAALTTSTTEFHNVAYTFLNEANQDSGITGSTKIPISHEGFEGAVAIIGELTVGEEMSDCETTQVLHGEIVNTEIASRTKLLWSLAHLYWSVIYCASEGYFEIASSESLKDVRTLKEVNLEIKKIESYQTIISMIKFESQPEKIIVEGEDTIAYAHVWQAYKAEELIISLSQIQQDAENMLITLRDKAQAATTKRTNNIIVGFTLLTIISVLVDLIIFYDVGSGIGAAQRITYLLVGIFVLATIGFLTWVIQFWPVALKNRKKEYQTK